MLGHVIAANRGLGRLGAYLTGFMLFLILFMKPDKTSVVGRPVFEPPAEHGDQTGGRMATRAHRMGLQIKQ